MVTTPTRQRAGSATDRNKDMMTGAIPWEIFSEEGRPLLWSHLVASGMALSFLLLVMFGPRTISIPPVRPADLPPMSVDMGGLISETRLAGASRSRSGGGDHTTTRSASQGGQKATGTVDAIRAALGFAPGGMVGSGTGALRGVQTGSGTGYQGLASIGSPQGNKAGLSYGETGGGSGRSGMGDGAGSGAGKGIGGVNSGGGVTRSAVTIIAPSVVAEKLGGPARDVGELGTYVRNRQAVLQNCYTQEGLVVNPKLAGTIDVAITLNGAGGVSAVNAKPRSMSGPGTSQVMSCIEGKIRNWKFPSSEAGSGTYSFPFSFTS